MPETIARDSATPCSSLVCPLDLRGFSPEGADGLRCASGHGFSVVQGMPDLTVVEDTVAHLHHRPDRRLLSVASYDDQRQAAPRSRGSTPVNRVRGLGKAPGAPRFYRRTVPRAYARLEVESPDRPPMPPADGFT